MKLTQKFMLLLLGFGIFLSCPGSLRADYTIVLKNGGRITVKAYREENGMVKFLGLGGEIGLARVQIQSIEEARASDPQGLVLGAMENSRPEAEATNQDPSAVGHNPRENEY